MVIVEANMLIKAEQEKTFPLFFYGIKYRCIKWETTAGNHLANNLTENVKVVKNEAYL